MSKLNMFVPITKIDAAKGLVYGILAKQEKDHSGEIFDYAGSKPYFEKWSAAISKATNGKSLGNLRAMHGNVAAGKFTSMNFNDADEQVEVCAKVVDKNELEKALEGVYTGFSIGGKYVSRKKDGDVFRYVADPYEGSLVDLPCMPSATFEVIKADGVTLQKKFNPAGDVEKKARELAKAAGIDPDSEVEDDETKIVKKAWETYEDAAIDELAKVVETKVIPTGKEPTNDEIAAKAKEIAKAAGGDANWLDHIDAARTALKAAAPAVDLKAPVVEKTAAKPGTEDGGAPAHGQAPGDDGTEAQVWVHKRLPGKQYSTKALMRQALIDLDATDKAGGIAKDVTTTLGDIQKVLDEHEHPIKKAAFDAYAQAATAAHDAELQKASGLSAEDWALAGSFALAHGDAPAVKALGSVHVVLDEKGAFKEMPEPTKDALKALVIAAKAPAKEPVVEADVVEITDKATLEAALKGFDPKKPMGFLTRRTVVQAAKKFGVDLPEGLAGAKDEPVDLKKIAVGDLRKAASLYSVGSLIQLLAQVDSCEESLECPGYGYGTIVPKKLCDRFGAVLVEMGDIVAEVLDLILKEMKAEEAAEASGSVLRIAHAVAGFSKLVADMPLAKAGARHSRADINMINEVHTLAVGLGAECGPEEDDAEKSVSGELRKQMAATEAAFTKTMGDVLDVVKDVAKRVKNIEAQPLPEGTSSYRVVEKGREAPIVGGADEQPAGGPLNFTGDARTNVEVFAELSSLFVKQSQRSPHHETPGFMRPRIG